MTFLDVQRALTKRFIDARPESIVFTPRSRTRLPAGGFKWTDGVPRAAEVVTFIELSAQSGFPRPVATLDGVERIVELEIVAQWGSPISRYDVFNHQGKEWEVVDLFYDNGYEVRALVSGRG